MITWDEFIREVYDEITDAAGEDGIKRADAHDLVVERVRSAINEGLIDPPDGVGAAVERTMRATDGARRGDLSEAILDAAAALNDETILGRNDPRLRQAFAVGEHMRKSLRFCDQSDLDAMVSARRKNMSNAVASFEKFASAIDDLKATMQAAHARLVDDLIAAS